MDSSASNSYLRNVPAWDRDYACRQADSQGIALTPEHLEIVLLARQFYDRFGFSPSIRPLAKYLVGYIGFEKATSLYLLNLFPGSPARLVANLGGLPKPKNCL